ncbi:interleukin-15-like [Brachionichthys hirsutus]|uniref:interleukin-15-like n=1 Tax=Brachionichthys hirsutus TaxID=412623 RepID=UPI0036053D0E
MTALLVILVQSTSPGSRHAKGVQLLPTCCLCRESHKSEVWLRFLILSFLSTYTCAASVPGTADVQICLNLLRHDIEKSDAMLYTPSTNDVKKNCKMMSLRCYMLELIMVINEEEIMDNNAECISDFDETLPEVNSVDCPPCEAYSLRNITVFLEELNNLLEEMSTYQSI